MNSSALVVLGDGLAAGASDFGISEPFQRRSFPAQVAAQLGVVFRQPIVQAPGLGPTPGLPDLGARLPLAMQTTVLEEFPPRAPFANVSIPGLTLHDAVTRRPTEPLVDRTDSLQTTINLILGMSAAAGTSPTPLEYAAALPPTIAVIELGFTEVLAAVFADDEAALPSVADFKAEYELAVRTLAATGATVVVSTIPDPSDTAVLTPVSQSARVLKAEPAVLSALFSLAEGDGLTPTGLIELGCRLITKTPSPLPKGSVVRTKVIAEISERVRALNAAIRSVAAAHRALVFDLQGLLADIRSNGLPAGPRRLSAEFLGGVYSLNGFSLGATGQGAVANGLLDLLNESGAKASRIDLSTLATTDPVTDYRLAQGPNVTLADLAALPPPVAPPTEPEEALSVPRPPTEGRLQLPPGLVQELPISPGGSFMADALRAAHTTEEADIGYGSTPNTLFGGLCMVESHLRGTIRITFTPPVDDVTHFVVTHGAGLRGNDATLVAPQFYRLPAFMNQVGDGPGLVSSGDLNLETGVVTNLTYNVMFANSALFALASANPKLPPTPISFPGQYGAAHARFDPRPDGLLDFTFRGSTFMPLGAGFGGDPVRFPLPFAGPAMSFASLPAVGTALHPQLRISTRAPEANDADETAAEIPANTVREFTPFVHNTAFGDRFDLHVKEHGGPATGRSHLMGRVQIQFGARTGDFVPFVLSSLPPGGLLASPIDSLIHKAFPGRLTVGFHAHDERLKYPTLQYDMHTVRWADDPFDLAYGSIDARTGRIVGSLLYRGFIIQNIIQRIMVLEPRTPKSAWHMRGPGAFHKDAGGQTIFAIGCADCIPYPEGFAFPQPNLEDVFLAGPNSQLDPFIYIQAMDGLKAPASGKSGSATSVEASNGQKFSYRYAIPADSSAGPALFEYDNETTGASYRMERLVWTSFTNAKDGAPTDACDVVTFTGLGRWSADPSRLAPASVQISTSTEFPYVTIQIDGGTSSNVNTKPPKGVLPLMWAPVPF